MAATPVSADTVFEMSDDLMADAVRQQCVAMVREHVKARDLLWVAASTAVFVLALRRDSHWVWWLAGLPAGILVLMAVAWLAAYLRLPRQACARLAHLPHRTVRVAAGPDRVAFETATERLEVAWSELTAVQRLPGFRMFALRSGARIPVPESSLNPDLAALIDAHGN